MEKNVYDRARIYGLSDIKKWTATMMALGDYRPRRVGQELSSGRK